MRLQPTVLEEPAFVSRLQIWPSLCVLLNGLQACVVDFEPDQCKLIFSRGIRGSRSRVIPTKNRFHHNFTIRKKADEIFTFIVKFWNVDIFGKMLQIIFVDNIRFFFFYWLQMLKYHCRKIVIFKVFCRSRKASSHCGLEIRISKETLWAWTNFEPLEFCPSVIIWLSLK